MTCSFPFQALQFLEAATNRSPSDINMYTEKDLTSFAWYDYILHKFWGSVRIPLKYIQNDLELMQAADTHYDETWKLFDESTAENITNWGPRNQDQENNMLKPIMMAASFEATRRFVKGRRFRELAQTDIAANVDHMINEVGIVVLAKASGIMADEKCRAFDEEALAMKWQELTESLEVMIYRNQSLFRNLLIALKIRLPLVDGSCMLRFFFCFDITTAPISYLQTTSR